MFLMFFLKPSSVIHLPLHDGDVMTRLSDWLGSVHSQCLNGTIEEWV